MVPTNQTSYIIDATEEAETKVTITSKAPVNITILRYKENPYPEVPLPPNSLPSVVDISVNNPDALEWPIYVERTYSEVDITGIDESNLGIYYFKDWAWHRCQETGVETDLNMVWARMQEDEVTGSPTIIGELPASAKFELSDISVSPSTIEPGGTITISVDVANLGEVSANYTVILKIDDIKEDSITVVLNGEASTRVAFSVTKISEGTYSVEIDGLLGNFTVVKPSTPPAPANFEIYNLEVTPDSIYPGEEVSTSLLVINVGEEYGSYTAEIEVDGTIVDSETVTLNGGESKSIRFTISSTIEGKHIVKIKSLTGSFNVTKPPQPQTLSPWVYVGLAIIIVVVVAYIGYIKR
jgi:hypothetical protein